MLKEINEKWETISKLNKEFDELYHKIALHYNLSDSAFWVLYTLYDNKYELTQKEICQDWYYSKQTINSAIKDLEKKEYIVLSYKEGSNKSKIVSLTNKGKKVAKESVGRIIEIENSAFSKIDGKEFDMVIDFFKKNIAVFKEELNNIL